MLSQLRNKNLKFFWILTHPSRHLSRPSWPFWGPWWAFWILQAVRRCRRLASAPFAARLVLQNKFFDPRSCSIRKGCDGEVEEKNSENSSSLASLPVDRLNSDRLQRRCSCQFQYDLLFNPLCIVISADIRLTLLFVYDPSFTHHKYQQEHN